MGVIDRAGSDGGRSVVLTGFMGTGKSTVGRLLARRLGYEFVDTDELIEQRHGPIPSIFATHGEAEFRRFEREVAAELADRRCVVVATGGRLMVDPVNAERLEAVADVVCLTAQVGSVLERVGDDLASRPMLAVDDPAARVAELMAERADAYARFPAVSTDGRDPDEVVDAIVELLTGAADDRP